MLFVALTFSLIAGLQLTVCFEWVCESCLRKASSYILCGNGIWSRLKEILSSTGKLVGVDKLKNFGNLHITIQFLLKNSSVLWCFILPALHRKGGGGGRERGKGRGIINSEHVRCKRNMRLCIGAEFCSRCPVFGGSVVPHQHLQLKIFSAKEGCKCLHLSCQGLLWSGFFLLFPLLNWFSGSFQPLWGCEVDGRVELTIFLQALLSAV